MQNNTVLYNTNFRDAFSINQSCNIAFFVIFNIMAWNTEVAITQAYTAHK